MKLHLWARLRRGAEGEAKHEAASMGRQQARSTSAREDEAAYLLLKTDGQQTLASG
jgi:hypothetical protein